jgi:hypothetical protein
VTEITPEDATRWNKNSEPQETPRELETSKAKTEELIIGEFALRVVDGVFKITHSSEAEWKFAPSSE